MRALSLLAISLVFVACSQSDWERLQMSPNSPVTYVAKNDDGEGFAVREGLLVASTDKLATILDSGTSYPFELYLSGDGYVTIYKGKTPEWYNPHGILLVSDLEKLFTANPQLREYFINADKMMLVILNDSTRLEMFRLEIETKGAEVVFNM
jgi:hypothetical protein